MTYSGRNRGLGFASDHQVFAQRHQAKSIQHVAELIRGRVEWSLKSGHARKLAGMIVNTKWTKVPVSGMFAAKSGFNYGIPFHGKFYHPGSSKPGVCGMKDNMCELTRIWNFMVANFRYMHDQDGADTYQSLRTTLEMGGGDCDDATIAFATLCRAAGFPTVARIISLRDNPLQWAHIYPLVNINGKWISLDITEPSKRMGWEYPLPAASVDFPMGASPISQRAKPLVKWHVPRPTGRR